MKYQTLNDLDFGGKCVLLRLDLNSEVSKGRIIESERFSACLPTLKELVGFGAKIVILAHQGRKGDDDFLSLRQHAKILNKYLKVKFVEDVIGKEAVSEIVGLKPGEILLLENVRFLDDELNLGEDNSLLKVLGNLGEIYVNDAFSVSHREQTSVVGFPKLMPSCIGRLMQRELESLEKVNLENCLYILGGAKAEDYLGLLSKARKVLACGKFGQLCAIASGIDFGRQNEVLREQFKVIPQLKKYLKKIVFPSDFAVKIDGKRKEILISDFPSNFEIYDIGAKSMEKFSEEIKMAKSIFYKGTAGYTEEKQFSKGTAFLLKKISESKAFSLIGGGHTGTLLEEIGLDKKSFGHVSLAGGALIAYVSGEKLPGLEVLEEK